MPRALAFSTHARRPAAPPEDFCAHLVVPQLQRAPYDKGHKVRSLRAGEQFIDCSFVKIGYEVRPTLFGRFLEQRPLIIGCGKPSASSMSPIRSSA